MANGKRTTLRRRPPVVWGYGPKGRTIIVHAAAPYSVQIPARHWAHLHRQIEDLTQVAGAIEGLRTVTDRDAFRDILVVCVSRAVSLIHDAKKAADDFMDLSPALRAELDRQAVKGGAA